MTICRFYGILCLAGIVTRKHQQHATSMSKDSFPPPLLLYWAKLVKLRPHKHHMTVRCLTRHSEMCATG